MGTLRSAAFRLKHDLGKGVLFGAGETLEADPEALRARLGKDLLATRRTAANEPLDAPAVFERWKAEDGPCLSRPETRGDLAALEEEVGELRRLLPRLPALTPGELAALDRLARGIAARCASLHRTAVALDGGA